MNKFVLSVAALAITAGGASAADMAVKAPVYRPPVVDPWAGFYVGANVGYSWGDWRADSSQTIYNFEQFTARPKVDGVLAHDWRTRLRKEQLAPLGDWLIWLFMGGRGTGKTLAGGNFVHELVQGGYGRIALVAPTASDCRDTMIEGVSGIMETAPNWNRPTYEPSKTQIDVAKRSVCHGILLRGTRMTPRSRP